MRNVYFVLVAIALLVGTLGDRPASRIATVKAQPTLVAQLGSVRLELRLSA